MSSSPDQLQAALTTALEHIRIISNVRVASLTFYAYESLLMLDLEINYVWKAPWNIGKILFLLTRYVPFVEAIADTMGQFVPYISSRQCKALYSTAMWTLLIGISVSEAVLTLRTWAVCGGRKWLGTVLGIIFIGVWGVVYGFGAVLNNSLEFQLQDTLLVTLLHPVLQGCLLTGGKSSINFIPWGMLFAYDTLNLLLMLIAAFCTFKEGHTNLITIVIRDGIIYYMYTFLVSLSNVTIFTTLSEDYFPILLPLAYFVHSASACRVILYTRREASKTHFASTTTMI